MIKTDINVTRKNHPEPETYNQRALPNAATNRANITDLKNEAKNNLGSEGLRKHETDLVKLHEITMHKDPDKMRCKKEDECRKRRCPMR